MDNCRNCGGEGWVCENHADRPWGGTSARDDACECGAGMPCGVCNLELAAAGLISAAVERALVDRKHKEAGE